MAATCWPSGNPSAAPPPSAEYQLKTRAAPWNCLLKQHEVSSIYHGLATARGNATHVGTVELIRALSEAVLTLEDDNAMPQSPVDALLLTNQVLERLSAVYEVIDHHWFHQEALSEEEVYRRFVQQQQQQ